MNWEFQMHKFPDCCVVWFWGSSQRPCVWSKHLGQVMRTWPTASARARAAAEEEYPMVNVWAISVATAVVFPWALSRWRSVTRCYVKSTTWCSWFVDRTADELKWVLPCRMVQEFSHCKDSPHSVLTVAPLSDIVLFEQQARSCMHIALHHVSCIMCCRFSYGNHTWHMTCVENHCFWFLHLASRMLPPFI